ncbi:uncharacterized protein LOC130990949 [Salvia miltiorrhiza]|uniref:uncharacterized protein LOC130990949 n=1 Tax=Salvia miltiorrhiza TaxID=226208 RepID=UPI0025AB6DC5|nr:uncharacterized protein LOC130990949 [Salvia miltiorrhiza]
MQVPASKRRGRPTKQEQAARAIGKITKHAEDSIKARLRNSGETGVKSREFIIDSSNKESIQAMDNVAKESWADESWDFRIAVVHGANNHIDRRILWGDLSRFVSGRTIFIGDFNAVKGAHERLSLVSPHRGSCTEFCTFIDDTQMLESPTEGLRFTWSGRRFLPRHVESVLDRAFFSQEFADMWDSIVTSALPRLTSDHSPLVLQCRQNVPTGRSQFRFLNMWTSHSNFMDMVLASWNQSVDALCPILRVMLKLKRMRLDLRVWNKDIFGNVDVSIARGQTDLMNLQNRISETGYTEELFDAEVSCQAKLNIALTRKNSLLQQKSRATWLKDGDRNTAFFHRIAKFKKRKTQLTRLFIDGVLDVYDPTIIERHLIDHFSSLFKDDGSPLEDQLVIDAYIDSCISEAQNNMLIHIPDESEIAAAVFGMDANSAPGPDGFSGMFFQTCWSVVKDDVILALRLNVVAATHVSANQFGFISGRSIHDCIMLSSEGFNCMQRTERGMNMACKIDIRKAFDTIRWGFIMQVLRANGYHESFIRWIQIIFDSARLSIIYNGRLSGYFACTRGVRQGDPLSPILFGIAEDVLSSILSSCVSSRHLVPMGFSRALTFPTHLFYADDIIIFCKATVRNARKVQDILNYYGSISGQHCSQDKSNLFFARRVPTDRRRAIRRELGFSIGSLPMNYLGVPIFVGRPKASYFMPIFDKIVNKFARWKGRQLSMAGRLCLVQSVIQSSIVHSMMVYKWPKTLLNSLDRKCRNFVWTGSIDLKPNCSVSWGRACSPKEEGGFGVRSFTLMNQSYLMKLAWRMIKGQDWAHNILRSRYLNSFGYAKLSIANSTVWIGVKQEVNRLVDDSYSCIDRGESTYFWKDDWLGYKLVDKLKIPHYMHDFLNFSIQDYFYDEVWHFSASFVNRFPEIVADILLLPMTGDKDHRYWKHSVKGEVTAALAFSSICHRFPQVSWGKWIWEPYIPVRRSILCWRVIHGRLPTLDILIRQGMIVPNGCPICLMDGESIDHIMWQCGKVRSIWKDFLSWFDKDSLWECMDIHSFLVAAWNSSFSPQIQALWKADILTIMWRIWDCHNSAVFDSARFEPRAVLVFVKSFFKEMDGNFGALGNNNNTWSDYLITRSIGVSTRPAAPPRMVEVHWWPPVNHWIKVNTDGSALGAPGAIAAGGVFRDKWSVVRGCFHIKGGVGYAFEAELLAVITAINIAHDRNWLHLWIEADSMYVVHLLQSKSLDVPWRFMASWKSVIDRLQNFNLLVSHIYREGNRPADIMANGDRNEGWWPFAINEIKHAVATDMSTHSHVREVRRCVGFCCRAWVAVGAGSAAVCAWVVAWSSRLFGLGRALLSTAPVPAGESSATAFLRPLDSSRCVSLVGGVLWLHVFRLFVFWFRFPSASKPSNLRVMVRPESLKLLHFRFDDGLELSPPWPDRDTKCSEKLQ